MGEISKFKMVYDQMEQMARVCQQSSEQLKDTLAQMQSIANTLEDGALLGQGGAAFVEAIRNKLCPAISRLEQKFLEEQKDLMKAEQIIKGEDAAAVSRIG